MVVIEELNAKHAHTIPASSTCLIVAYICKGMHCKLIVLNKFNDNI